MILKNQIKRPLLFIPFLIWGATFPTFALAQVKLSSEKARRLETGSFISQVEVETFRSGPQKEQKMTLLEMGLHPQACPPILAKLKHYERYADYLDFITTSTYEESSQWLNLGIDSPLLPYPLSLRFQLPRIAQPGVYPFLFSTGIFPNLQGVIEVFTYKDRCLFSLKADWQGPHTGIPDMVIEIFSQTLLEKGMEKLFRLSFPL